MRFNPRYIEGFGLSDGEVCERLWSFLRRFAIMTKEMRPAHRVDVLTDALHYHARKSAGGLGTLNSYSDCITVHTYTVGKRLLKRMKHALKVQEEATDKLQALTEESPGSVH